MKIYSITVFSLLICFSLKANAQNKIFVDDFESDIKAWDIRAIKTKRVNSLRTAPKLDSSKASTGKTSLAIFSPVLMFSPRIEVKPLHRYEMSMDSFSPITWRFSTWIEEYDHNGKKLNHPESNRTVEGLWKANLPKRNFWLTVKIPFDTSKKCAYVKIVIRKSWSTHKIWLDNIIVREVKSRHLLITSKPKQEKLYSINSLMLPGPDGLLYPNWTQAGVTPETKFPKKIYHIKDFGGKPDDGIDDSNALEKACTTAGKAGGGIVKLAPGKYIISRKIMISADNVYIRGSGRKKTKLEFKLPKNGISIFPICMGRKIRSKSPIKIYFPARKAKKISLYINEKLVRQWNPEKIKKISFAKTHKKVSCRLRDVIKGIKLKNLKLKAEMEYANGEKKTSETSVIISSSRYSGAWNFALISFNGAGLSQKKYPLSKDGLRGDRVLHLTKKSTFVSGDLISICAKKSERWNKLAHNTCNTWGEFRRFVTRVSRVEDNRVYLTQPLRIDFPVSDRSRVCKFNAINNCGIENLTIIQSGKVQKDLKIGAVAFNRAVNCRALNVTIENPGSMAIIGAYVKNCEIKNCIFRNPWNTGTGGRAYGGWEFAWDCLIENLETFKMRHAPILNWTCTGNVIRDSVFHESDAQWHSGWCRDNLYEQCTVESTTKKHRGYGYGFYSTTVDDSMHGPNGPRNVVYNCKSISLKDGVYLGGMNQQWMIMYSKFIVNNGAGVIARFGCRDNIIKGNIFVLKNSSFPMVYYEFMDNTGDKLIDNIVYGGNGKLYAGPGSPEIVKNNRFFPLSANQKKSTPPVPSIYKWQKSKYKN